MILVSLPWLTLVAMKPKVHLHITVSVMSNRCIDTGVSQ